MRRGCKLNSNTVSQLLVVGGSASSGQGRGRCECRWEGFSLASTRESRVDTLKLGVRMVKG